MFQQEEKQKVPKMQPPAPGDPPKIEVIREKRPSLAPEPPSRRGSLIPPADTGRRPSLIINDEVSSGAKFGSLILFGIIGEVAPIKNLVVKKDSSKVYFEFYAISIWGNSFIINIIPRKEKLYILPFICKKQLCIYIN